ncbi:MAG: right-handed parallel beta-helix repeat-containing protein, partial [Thermoplasmata archaeon]|nr:right-handed parallel beta-helix repeat-containing protein [Thermoplasmata archaeon]
MGIYVTGIIMVGDAQASPNVVYVDDDFNDTTPGWQIDHFNSINDALNAVEPGGTIYVWNGTYHENMDVTKSVTIIGNGSESCIIKITDRSKAIFWIDADHVNITGFNLSGGGAGVNIDNASDYCNVSNNIMYNNTWGVGIFGIPGSTSPDYMADHNVITNNTILNNTEGIWMYKAQYNTIKRNVIKYSQNRGIHMDTYSGYNVISDNYIENNEYGIKIEDNYHQSSNNQIYNNYFCDNDCNAYDDCSNTWNISKTAGKNIVGSPYLGGNYWDDYTGSDTDDDGLGDTNLPYNCNGNIQNGGDMHPLVTRVHNLNQERWYYSLQSAIDNASNGDTIVVHDGIYYENVVIDKELALINGSKPVVDGMGGIAFNITANNVSIIGFNITNSSYGIKCNALGFYIANNTINATIDGINIFLHNISCNMTGSSSFVIGDSIIYKNTINATNNGVVINASYWGCNMSDNAIFEIGNFKIIENNISCMNGIKISMHHLGYNLADDSSFSMGNLAFNGNVINSSGAGIYVDEIKYVGYNLEDNATYTMGDLEFNDNVINASSDGIYVYEIEYIGYEMYGNASFVMGSITFNNNIINSSDDGIYFEIDDAGSYMHDNASATVDETHISDNNIESGGCGIYLYYYDMGYYIYDNSSFSMDNIYIQNNNISAGDDAIYMYYDYVAYEMENNASFTMNDIYIENNNIDTSSDGIYIYYYDYDVGYDACNNVTIKMPYYYISSNNISADDCGIYFYTYSNPDDIYDNATVDFGAIYIDNNNISCDYGIYLYLEDMPENSYDDARLTFNDIVITNNRILNCTYEGIYIYVDEVPYYPEDDSKLIFGDIIISENELHNCSNGVYIEYGPETYYNVQGYYGYINITDNIIANMTNDGIYIYYYPSADDSSAIYMKATNIWNNTISNCINGIHIYGDIYNDSTAILDMEGIVINNNTISNCSGYDSGIHIEAIDGNEVTNNTLYNCSYGIALIHSASNYVFNNSIYAPIPYDWDYYGIYMKYVNYSNISWNNMIYNISQEESDFTGIYAYHCNNNTMDNNTIEKEGNAGDDSFAEGIYLYISTWNIVENNFVFSYYDEAIHLYESSNNTIWNNTLTTNFTYYGAYIYSSPYNLILNNTIYKVKYGIYLSGSRNNEVVGNMIKNATSHGIEVSSTGNVIDKNTIYNSTGILIFSGSNNIISNNTIRDIRRGFFPMSSPGGAAGIWLGSSSTNNNYFFNNTITGSNETCNVYGILLQDGASNNVFDHIRIGNLNSTDSVYGIYIYMHSLASNNNIFSNCTIYGMDGNNAYAFYSTENNKNNTIHNMTVASYPTTVSFIYGNGIALKGVDSPPPFSNRVPLNKYLNITNVSSNSWINITFYYSSDEIYYVDNIGLYHYNESDEAWESVTSNEGENAINANLSSFSIYGLFADELNIGIRLHKPWNLISMPVNKTLNASQLADSIEGCVIVVMWDAEEQKYVDYIAG